MDYEDIVYEVEDRVATITLYRPDKLNAQTATMTQEIHAALSHQGPLVPDRHRRLALEAHTAAPKLDGQRLLVDALQESRSQRSVHLNHSADHRPSARVNSIVRLSHPPHHDDWQ